MKLRFSIWFFAVLAVPAAVFGQPGGRVEIQHANDLHAMVLNGENVQKLKGNVQFRQGDVTMTCDSAIFYGQRDVVNAFGNVHINQHDTLHVYGDVLDYDGKTRYGTMRQHVRMTDRQMTLTTEKLDYDFVKKEALYTGSGVITDAENRLTSQAGYYFSDTRDMFFHKNVVLVNPKFTMHCDTLQYNTITRRATFLGPTTIESREDKSFIYCETGWYNTLTNIAQFGKKAYLKQENQFLYGDSLYYDRDKGFGRAINNIRVIDTAEKLTVEGQYAEHYQKEKKTFITNQVFVTKLFKKDTMYMSGDTLWLTYDSSGRHRIMRAYYKAKVYNRQFQAISDSLIYSTVDSTLDMRVKPVFWFGTYQATAKRILVHTKDNKVSRADMYQDAFLASAEDSLRYSQVKGRNMVGYFNNNELNKIDVNGNSESIYYARDDNKKYIGMNKIISSDIKINIKDRKISRINFIKDPDANLIPMKEAKPSEAKLSGFTWHGKEKPKGPEDLRRPREEIKYRKPASAPAKETKKGRKKKGKGKQ